MLIAKKWSRFTSQLTAVPNKPEKKLKDLKIPEQQLVNDVLARWGSKYKMLQRIKHLQSATNQILMNDWKYRDLTLNWQDAALIDVFLKCLERFNVLTDLLSSEKAVTML